MPIVLEVCRSCAIRAALLTPLIGQNKTFRIFGQLAISQNHPALPCVKSFQARPRKILSPPVLPPIGCGLFRVDHSKSPVIRKLGGRADLVTDIGTKKKALSGAAPSGFGSERFLIGGRKLGARIGFRFEGSQSKVAVAS